MDVSGVRHRLARRALEKHKPRKKRQRREAIVDDLDLDDAFSIVELPFGGEGGNAMFGFHAAFRQETDASVTSFNLFA